MPGITKLSAYLVVVGVGQFQGQQSGVSNHLLKMPSVVARSILLLLVWPQTAVGLFQQRREQHQLEHEARETYEKLREAGVDAVGHTEEAAALREYRLRKKKRKGLLRKQKASLASVLFPGVSPEVYTDGEEVFAITDMVQSKKTHVPFQFYDTMPGCEQLPMANFKRMRKRHQRKNLGARLQGLDLQPAPYKLKVRRDVPCTVLCETTLRGVDIRKLRRLVERQYRSHMSFDSLPVLMRSEDLNYAVRGFPVGFMAVSTNAGLEGETHYLYNHLKLTISYKTLEEGYHVTGFDVHPVSIEHGENTCSGEEEDETTIDNDPSTYLALREEGMALKVTYSYEVQWMETDLEWQDRWDVYLMNSPDDDIHFFAIVNSLMIVLFLTGAIATIMIKTLKRDIAAYNEVSMMDVEAEETGWKLVHGDVFRPPQNQPMLLAIVVGTGAQIGTAFFATMLTAIVGLVNPIKKGQTLTAILVLYVMSGSVSGYIAARISKFSGCKSVMLTATLTATGLPGFLVGIFTFLNIFLAFAGAATAVPFWLLLSIFALWVCVSAPLVFLGAFFGGKAKKIEVPVKTNQIARVIPAQHWFTMPPVSYLLGGILPFGSVCIELFFIMSALWLHQIYYVMGFLLAVLLILAATCAQVSIVMDYLQLCAEDHRWWWKSFFNCSSAGLYLFLYSLWFLVSRLELVGFLPVVIYLTYMGMISLCFGLFCGSVGFLCSFAFNRTIYGALKVD